MAHWLRRSWTLDPRQNIGSSIEKPSNAIFTREEKKHGRRDIYGLQPNSNQSWVPDVGSIPCPLNKEVDYRPL